MTVRTNFVDDEHATVIPAASFATVVGRTSQRHHVTLLPRPGWTGAVSGLERRPSEKGYLFVAKDFDELVDSPITAGTPIETSFSAGGKEHRIATFGADETWDAEKSTNDVEKIVREQQAFWGDLPYDRYLFQNVLLSSGGQGGLEHLDSTLLLAERSLMVNDPARYRSWLSLVSHEFFHAWNGKRLRPLPLGPFDYENEVYTEDLWIVEGLTSYYDDLTLARAGLYTEEQYLTALSKNIERLETTPGRHIQPLRDASYNAWIKFYRRDENTANTAISYYTKGAVVGFILDATIRRATGGARSLDDVMRAAYRRFSGQRGYTSSEFRQVASEIAQTDLGPFFQQAVDSTADLDYRESLLFYGLRFAPKSNDSKEEPASHPAYLGIVTSKKNVVSSVVRDTPAYRAGLNVADEIIAINGERLTAGGHAATLKRHKPGEPVEILIARRKRLRTITVTLAKKATNAFTLERLPNRTAAQAGRASSWLSSAAR